MRFRNYNKKKFAVKKKKELTLFFCVFAIAFIFLKLDAMLSPALETFARYQSTSLANDVVNEAVLDVLSQNSISYNDIIELSYSQSGEIISMQANSFEINLFKAMITTNISNRLRTVNYETISIPLGTLTGVRLFNGRGPNVRFKIQSASFVQSQLVSEVETAGINQVKHKINLRVSIEVTAVIPGHATTVLIETDVAVAEFIIAGQVPQTFADFSSGILAGG